MWRHTIFKIWGKKNYIFINGINILKIIFYIYIRNVRFVSLGTHLSSMTNSIDGDYLLATWPSYWLNCAFGRFLRDVIRFKYFYLFFTNGVGRWALSSWILENFVFLRVSFSLSSAFHCRSENEKKISILPGINLYWSLFFSFLLRLNTMKTKKFTIIFHSLLI